MREIRDRLTYANVVATLCLFLLLGGGAAYASSHLGTKTVGTKQLKGGAVTAAKLKKNAVTRAKIKKGAVDGSKISDGSVSAADVNAASMPFSQIVHEARASGTVSLTSNTTSVYPLENATYTQEPGRDDFYAGALDVTVPASCVGNRTIYASVLVDPATPTKATPLERVATGEFFGGASGTVSGRINLGPSNTAGVRFQPSSATNHTLYLAANANCTSGGGVTATFGAVDVIGVK